jgi:hypothetical protein
MHTRTAPIPPEIYTPCAWDRSRRGFGNTTTRRDALGLVAGTQLREGLEQTVSWARGTLSPINRCMAQHLEHLPQIRPLVS